MARTWGRTRGESPHGLPLPVFTGRPLRIAAATRRSSVCIAEGYVTSIERRAVDDGIESGRPGAPGSCAIDSVASSLTTVRDRVQTRLIWHTRRHAGGDRSRGSWPCRGECERRIPLGSTLSERSAGTDRSGACPQHSRVPERSRPSGRTLRPRCASRMRSNSCEDLHLATADRGKSHGRPNLIPECPQCLWRYESNPACLVARQRRGEGARGPGSPIIGGMIATSSPGPTAVDRPAPHRSPNSNGGSRRRTVTPGYLTQVSSMVPDVGACDLIDPDTDKLLAGLKRSRRGNYPPIRDIERAAPQSRPADPVAWGAFPTD